MSIIEGAAFVRILVDPLNNRDGQILFGTNCCTICMLQDPLFKTKPWINFLFSRFYIASINLPPPSPLSITLNFSQPSYLILKIKLKKHLVNIDKIVMYYSVWDFLIKLWDF